MSIDNHDGTITQYIMICIIMSFGYPIDFAIMQPSQIIMVHYDEYTGLHIFVKVYETKCIFRLLNIWFGNDINNEVFRNYTCLNCQERKLIVHKYNV